MKERGIKGRGGECEVKRNLTFYSFANLRAMHGRKENVSLLLCLLPIEYLYEN